MNSLAQQMSGGMFSGLLGQACSGMEYQYRPGDAVTVPMLSYCAVCGETDFHTTDRCVKPKKTGEQNNVRRS